MHDSKANEVYTTNILADFAAKYLQINMKDVNQCDTKPLEHYPSTTLVDWIKDYLQNKAEWSFDETKKEHTFKVVIPIEGLGSTITNFIYDTNLTLLRVDHFADEKLPFISFAVTQHVTVETFNDQTFKSQCATTQ